MEARPWGLSPLTFKVLELQPGEKSRICQTGNAFLWWAKLWRGRWRTCFIWVTSSFPSFQRKTSPSASARRENSHCICTFASRWAWEDENSALLCPPTKAGQRSERGVRGYIQRTASWGTGSKKSQLHFRTVAYFSQHTLAAASWGGASIILSSATTLVPWCCIYAIKEFLKIAFMGIFACFDWNMYHMFISPLLSSKFK